MVLALGVDAVRHATAAAQELRSVERFIGAAQAHGAGGGAPALPLVQDALAGSVRAEKHLSAVSVSLSARLPVVGGTLTAARAAARSSRSLLEAARTGLVDGPRLRGDGGFDVAALSALTADLEPLCDAAESELRVLRGVLREEWLPPQVRPDAERAAAALADATRRLDQVTAGLDVAGGLLGRDGPRDLLLVLGNNAELRGTGGYVSTFATGTVTDGRLVLEPFRDVAELSDPPGAARRVPAPEEFVEDFGAYRADTTLWREWTMTPDVPDAAAVAVRAFDALTGRRPDAVVLLDVPALAALVRLTGQDVVLPQGAVTPDALTEALLVDGYAQAGTQVAAQDERRAALRAAAGATAAGLVTGDVDPVALAGELGGLVRGRHLALWSARPDEQALLERLGAAGSADPEGDDLLLFAANNLNANKLDYYVDRTVAVDATVHAGRVDVTQTVRLRNDAPRDLVPYVAGVDAPGTVVERVEFSLSPRAVFDALREDGQPTSGGIHRGGERTRVHAFVELARGEEVELVLRYALPRAAGTDYVLRLVPQALARDARLDVVVRAGPGQVLTGAEGARLDAASARRSGAWTEQERITVSTQTVDATG